MKTMTKMQPKSNGRATANIVTLDPSLKALVLDMPDHAPPLGFDPMADGFDWSDVLPDNYWSMELVQARTAALGGAPIYTPSHVTVQPVFDPTMAEKDRDMTPKLVMYFVENAPGLVLNKSRCELATELTGSRNPAYWARSLGPIALEVGILNGKAQIVFSPVTPNDDDLGF